MFSPVVASIPMSIYLAPVYVTK